MEAALGGVRALAHRLDHHALRLLGLLHVEQQAGQLAVGHLAPLGLLQPRDPDADLPRADGVAQARVGAKPPARGDLPVDPHQLAGGVQQRAAGVAGVQGGVGHQGVGVVAVDLVPPGDDPEGKGRRLVDQSHGQRVADGQGVIAQPQGLGVADFQAGHGLALGQAELEQGQVAADVAANQLGLVVPAGAGADVELLPWATT